MLSGILGVTDVDLAIPMLSFLFGQAQLDGRVAVVSLCRLHQEFYGLPADRGLLRERTVKEVLHELGHTFGLAHCSDSEMCDELWPRTLVWWTRRKNNIASAAECSWSSGSLYRKGEYEEELADPGGGRRRSDVRIDGGVVARGRLSRRHRAQWAERAWNWRRPRTTPSASSI